MRWDGVRNPFFLAITLSATSLGLVAPVLPDAGQRRTVFGQLTIVGATLGEFGAITTLLSLFFSATKGGTASNVIAFGTFGAVVAAVGVTLGSVGRNPRLEAFLTRLQDTPPRSGFASRSPSWSASSPLQGR